MASWKWHSASRGLIAVAIGFSLFGAAVFAQPPKPRKWKDASGKFEIEATFVSEANGLVTLKQTNGEEVEIELKQLSPADEAYVQTELAAKKSPFKSRSTPSPFQSKSGDKSSPGSSEPAKASGAAPTAEEISWVRASLLTAPSKTNWNAISIDAPERKAKSSQLPAKRDIFERFSGMATGDGFAILGYFQPESPQRPESGTTRLVRVNLETGKVEGAIVADGVYALLDVSPSGEEILMRKEADHAFIGNELEVWKPSGKIVERVRAFVPFAAEPHQKQVQTALLGQNGRVVVVGQGSKAGIFDLRTGDAIAAVTKGYAACLSPDRKYAAILSDDVLIVDIARGEAVASLPTDRRNGSAIAFSPDGKKLAVAFSNSLTAWDLKTGKVYRDEIVAGMSAGQTSTFTWTSPTQILVGTHLIDLENHLPLWTYTGADKAVNYGGTTLVAADRPGQAGALVVGDLPHAAATAALKQALALPDLFAVKPGTAVTVDVSGLPDAAEQQKAKAALEARLTASGLKPAPGAPVVLKASLTSQAKDEHYRIFGAGLETRTINVTRYTSKVELLINGQSAWHTIMGSGPSFHVAPKANETLEDAVRNSSKPNYSFFASVSIPQYVLQPGKTTLGSSNIAGF
jgi:WD40 repeat protein